MRFARLLRGVAGCGLAAHSTRVAESNCDRPEGTAETRSLRDGETDQRSALRQRGMAMGSQVRVIGVDHLVLNVADVERSLSFYCDKLGLTPERLEEWRRGETRIPSVRVNPTTIIDLVAAPRAGQCRPLLPRRRRDGSRGACRQRGVRRRSRRGPSLRRTGIRNLALCSRSGRQFGRASLLRLTDQRINAPFRGWRRPMLSCRAESGILGWP